MKHQLNWLKQAPIAHRGLYEPGAEYPENSLPAFERAIKQDYAIELDIQLTSDRTIVVFHDEDLKRMCNLNFSVRNIQKDQLENARLNKSTYKIPTLKEVLTTVNGRVPLLIEIKHWVKVNNDLHTIVNTLLPYKGLYAIQSFNPRILGWFYKNAPHIPRGQLSGSFKNQPINALVKIILGNCMLNFISNPDFISYEASALLKKWIQKKRQKGMPVLAWTINNTKVYDSIRYLCDNIIFEGFTP